LKTGTEEFIKEIKHEHITRNIKNWAVSGKYEHFNIKKRCGKLKDWCFKMPNFSYCHRYKQGKISISL